MGEDNTRDGTLDGALHEAFGDPDDGSTYYHHWLAALRHLVAAKGLLAEADIARRKAAWAEAYATTAHGEPGANCPPRPRTRRRTFSGRAIRYGRFS